METSIIISLLAGFAVGAALIGFYFKSKQATILAGLQEKLNQQQSRIGSLETEKKILLSEKDSLIKQSTKAEAAVELIQIKLSEQKLELEQIGERFKFEFTNLAQSILDEKTAKFTEVNEAKMNAILNPLKLELGEFKKKVDDTYDKESKERFSLGREIEKLVRMSQQVSQEANNLTTALKGNNKMQGNWGEMILESILEHSGLAKGREYVVQEFIRDAAGNIIKDENGKGLQPDVTISYPDQRKVIIDSKVSLVAWEQYISEEDVLQQKKWLQAHLNSLRIHIESLSKKNYPKYAQALDYVLLFIPIEPAFLEAVKTDTQLWKYAYERKILLVSPTNLLAVLKIVADLWKVEQQNLHAIEIADKAGALYDKFVGFVSNLEDVGKKINDAQRSYDDAFKQLSTGRGNLVGRAEELKKMGANANKQLPDKILYDLNMDE
jgi:DNA recombination protein RmuC